MEMCSGSQAGSYSRLIDVCIIRAPNDCTREGFRVPSSGFGCGIHVNAGGEDEEEDAAHRENAPNPLALSLTRVGEGLMVYGSW